MPYLEFQELTKSFGELRALDRLSFEVPDSEIFGFVGSNGAGKSTTMRIALGVLEADSGSVHLDGKPLTLESRQRIGYMPEERGLYPKMKVGAQLTYLAQLHGMSKSDAISAMERWTDRLGIGARRGDLVQALSLGNQQRVQLAAALVHDPDVLILDEPFSGLDPVAVDVMSTVLQERAAAGAPVIFSSHQLELVERLCDRVGIIQSGHMVAVGSVSELQARGGDRWRISVSPGADATWVTALPQIQVVSINSTEIEFLALTPGAEQSVLQKAQSIGPVTDFGRRRVPLADLFRDAVTTTSEESA